MFIIRYHLDARNVRQTFGFVGIPTVITIALMDQANVPL